MNDSAPLKHEEALRLLALAKEGDESAQELLVKRNIALVKSIIKKYLNRGVDYDDLFQIGCLGLVKAIKNYDPAYQVRFSTYAVPMIAGEVKRYLRDDGMVKVSRSLKELAIKVAAAQEKLNLRFGREAGIMEIAEETGADPGDIVMALEASRPHASIYDPVYGDDSDACVMDKLASDEDCESGIVNRILLKELLSQLDPRERQLIMMRYFMNKTQSDTAKELGVSQVQVSRLESKILKKLRDVAGEC
ncbi:MAG: SigB/SigF/SigG family RNA polymerase sigma factor [Candidatus Gastranaerophilaceae bacterium]|jgi:RNA polymerase sporulation-specific sigma factor|nr:SigB/SigF/SigG family RNA polymerase sigma factor [Christensenellales bacterium]